MSLEYEAGDVMRELGTALEPESISSTALPTDPGLIASMAGGTVFSEPVQWLMVTLAGIFCAAVGQEVLYPRWTVSEQPISDQPDSPPTASIRAEALSVEGPIQPAPLKLSPRQASMASYVEASSAPAVATPEVNASSPLRALSANPQPGQLDVSSTKPARLRTPAGIPTSPVANVSTASSPEDKHSPAKSTCQQPTRCRLFGGRRR